MEEYRLNLCRLNEESDLVEQNIRENKMKHEYFKNHTGTIIRTGSTETIVKIGASCNFGIKTLSDEKTSHCRAKRMPIQPR